MKKRLFAALGALLFCSSVFAGESTGNNALANPGFEQGKADWVINDDTSAVTPDAARTGSAGLRVGNQSYNPDGSSVSSERFAVEPGQKIGMRFYARTTSKVCGVYFSLFDGKGKQVAIKGKTVATIDKADGNWNAYSLDLTVPENIAAVSLWVHTYAGAKGTVDIDDLEFTGIAPGATPLPVPPPRRKAAVKNVTADEIPPRATPPMIVLKLDDLHPYHGGIAPSWKRMADFLEKRKIKGSFGIICNDLGTAKPEFIDWVKHLHANGTVEFWFHGWDHQTHTVDGVTYNEFKGRDYTEQRKHFDDSQKLVQETLGFVFNTFGPPGGVSNGSLDDVTIRVMQDEPNMSVWLYPQPLDEAGKQLAAKGKVTVLDRVWAVNLEGAVGVPNYQAFLNGYAANLDRPYFVLQGHPAGWSDERYEEFTRIVDFLTAQKAVFMTPVELAAALKK